MADRPEFAGLDADQDHSLVFPLSSSIGGFAGQG
jgi:hypothetical protein